MRALFPRRVLRIALALAVGLWAVPSRADDASARWIAALPFGGGQIHRGDIGLGIFFAAGEAVLGGISIGTAAAALRLSSVDVGRNQSSSPDVPQYVDIPALNAKIRTVTMVNRIAFAGWAALTAVGVIEAQVNLRPRRSEHGEHPRPPVGLTIGVEPGGASMGLHMVF